MAKATKIVNFVTSLIMIVTATYLLAFFTPVWSWYLPAGMLVCMSLTWLVVRTAWRVRKSREMSLFHRENGSQIIP